MTDKELQDCLKEKVDWRIIAILVTIFLGIFGYSWANQNRIEASSVERDNKNSELIRQMKDDMASVKTNIEWLDKLRKEGNLEINSKIVK